jgi:hypothetical protein
VVVERTAEISPDPGDNCFCACAQEGRGPLLELARAGHLELPSATHVHRNPSVRRATIRTKAPSLLQLDTTPLEVSLRGDPREFGPPNGHLLRFASLNVWSFQKKNFIAT